VVSIITQRFCKAPHRTAPHRKRFSFGKNVAKKVSNARACDSQRFAARLPQAIRTAFAASPQVASAGGVSAELRCGAVWCVASRYRILVFMM